MHTVWEGESGDGGREGIGEMEGGRGKGEGRRGTEGGKKRGGAGKERKRGRGGKEDKTCLHQYPVYACGQCMSLCVRACMCAQYVCVQHARGM